MREKTNNTSIILFDGICNFCNSSVHFIIKHDHKNKFRFAALQSEAGKTFLEKFNLKNSKMDSIVLIENDRFFLKSSAALRISKQLNGLYPLLYIFVVIPSFIRNFIYDFFARNRYKWFGKKEVCMVPTEELKEKFIS